MSPVKPSLRRRLWKWFAATLAGVLILLAIGVGLFRLAVPLVPGLKADAEAMAERALGWPVRIGALDLEWAVFGPQLVLTDVQLLAPDNGRPLVGAAQLDIEFGPLDLFQGNELRPSHIRLHRPTLALERDAAGRLYLSGFALPAAGNSRVDWREWLEFGLRHGRVTVLDGELHYRDATREINDWELRLPEVSLASDGSKHELDARITPPGALGAALELQFSAEGSPGQPERWRWHVALEARQLVLDEWYRQTGFAGAGSLRGEVDVAGTLTGVGLGEWRGSGALSARDLRLAASEPGLAPVGGAVPPAFEQFAFNWKLELSGERRALTLDNMLLEHDGLRNAGAALSWRTPGQRHALELEARALPLASLAGLANFLPSSADASGPFNELRDALRRAAPAGFVDELALGLDNNTDRARFDVRARFRDLAMERWGKLPGFSGVSGSVDGDQKSGLLTLDSRDAQFDFGTLFRDRLPVQALRGNFSWQATRAGWQIGGREIVVINPEAEARATLELELPADDVPRIDLTAVARDIDLTARSTWLPAGIMSEPLIDWLDNAILAGRVPQATVTLRGPLQGFPYRDGSGVFDIRFELHDTVIDYAPGWPRIDGMRAAVHFRGPALDVEVAEAQVAKLAASGQARFADLRDGVLEVSSETSGDLRDAWAFLAASPLREPLSGVLNALDTSGPMSAKVDLNIPLKHTTDTEVKVIASLDGVRVKPHAVPWQVEDLRGALAVTEHDLRAESLRGRFTGAPMEMAIVPLEAVDEGFAPLRITLAGHTALDAFQPALDDIWLERLEGAFDWRGEFDIRPGGELELNLHSTLAGVQSRLPAPFDIAPAAALNLSWPAPDTLKADFTLAGLAAGRLRYLRSNEAWQFANGALDLGAATPPDLPELDGLHLAGKTARLDLGEWLAFAQGDRASGGEAGSTEAVLQSFDIEVERLEVGGVELAGQRLDGKRMGQPAGWAVELDGPAQGRISLPAGVDGEQPWNVALEHLHLPAPPENADPAVIEKAPPPDPRDLPPVSLDIRDLRFGSMQLGHVSGALHRTAIGYTTQKLRARGPSFDVELDGRWEVVDAAHYTSINARLDSRDVGRTLANFGYAAAAGIDADSGHLDANVAWHAAPTAVELGMLQGSLAFSMRDGSLSEVSPGAGRLVGLFSLAALPRRLLLDFSDFFGEGLHFDTLDGEFLLTDGNAYTTNVQLRGPSVSALLVGRTGLLARDYDQLAIVSPDVSASIPVAGYLAAGPNVGAALLLLSQLLKAPLTDITQVKYRITGSWDDPVIERVEQGNARNKETQN